MSTSTLLWLSTAPSVVTPEAMAADLAASTALMTFSQETYDVTLEAGGLAEASPAPRLPGLREEGTSYHYLAPDVACRPTSRALEDLRSFLSPTTSWAEGGVWTTDAPFRETFDKVRSYAMQGALVVEMECTALMAVAAYRGVEFGAVLVVTDELFGQRWHTAFDAEAVRAARRTACEAVGRGIRSKLK